MAVKIPLGLKDLVANFSDPNKSIVFPLAFLEFTKTFDAEGFSTAGAFILTTIEYR